MMNSPIIPKKDATGIREVWVVHLQGFEICLTLDELRALMHGCLIAYDEEVHLRGERAIQQMMIEPVEKSKERVLRSLK
jgi:hypothetical protein